MKTFLIVALAVLMTACGVFEPDVEVTKPQHAQEAADSFVYVKAKNGLCFGVTTLSRMSTGGYVAMNNIIVHVPCEAVGL